MRSDLRGYLPTNLYVQLYVLARIASSLFRYLPPNCVRMLYVLGKMSSQLLWVSVQTFKMHYV